MFLRGPPPPGLHSGARGQRRGQLPSSVCTRHGAVRQGQSGGSVGTTSRGKGRGWPGREREGTRGRGDDGHRRLRRVRVQGKGKGEWREANRRRPVTGSNTTRCHANPPPLPPALPRHFPGSSRGPQPPDPRQAARKRSERGPGTPMSWGAHTAHYGSHIPFTGRPSTAREMGRESRSCDGRRGMSLGPSGQFWGGGGGQYSTLHRLIPNHLAKPVPQNIGPVRFATRVAVQRWRSCTNAGRISGSLRS